MVALKKILENRWARALLAALALLAVGYVAGARRSRAPPVDCPRTRLKNALLTKALMSARRADFHDLPTVGYASFDGTKLPAPAGSDLASACFTYTLDGDPSGRARWRADRWFTEVMDSKYAAVDRYLQSNLADAESCRRLFEDYASATEEVALAPAPAREKRRRIVKARGSKDAAPERPAPVEAPPAAAPAPEPEATEA